MLNNEVFHLLAIFVKVAEPEDKSIVFILLRNTTMASSDTLIKAMDIIRPVDTSSNSQAESLNPSAYCANLSTGHRRTSNPAMLNRRAGLWLEYTLAKAVDVSSEQMPLGSLFPIYQSTALPNCTSWPISLIL